MCFLEIIALLTFQHEPGDPPQGLPALLPGSPGPSRYVYLA